MSYSPDRSSDLDKRISAKDWRESSGISVRDVARFMLDVLRDPRKNKNLVPLVITMLFPFLGPMSSAMAQDTGETGVATEVARETSIVTTNQDANVRAVAGDLDSRVFGTLPEGVSLEVTESDVVGWLQVLGFADGQSPSGLPSGLVVAVEGGQAFIYEPLTTAESGDAPIIVTDAPESETLPGAIVVPLAPDPDDDEAGAFATEAPFLSSEQILERISTGLVELGEIDPNFSGPIEFAGMNFWHLDNSTYVLGSFGTTNGTWLVSYCAPIAAGMELSNSGVGNPVAVANSIVEELGYGSSTAIMSAIGGESTGEIAIGGVSFDLERWGYNADGIAQQLEEIPVGGSTIVVMRNVQDTSKVGHLVSIQRTGDDQFVIIQSLDTRGTFLGDSAAMNAASGINASNGGVFVGEGTLDEVAEYTFRIGQWFYSTGVVGMTPTPVQGQ